MLSGKKFVINRLACSKKVASSMVES